MNLEVRSLYGIQWVEEVGRVTVAPEVELSGFHSSPSTFSSYSSVSLLNLESVARVTDSSFGSAFPSTFPSFMLTWFSVNFSAMEIALLQEFWGVLWDTRILSLINAMYELPQISIILAKHGFGNFLFRSKVGLKQSAQPYKCQAQPSRRKGSTTSTNRALGGVLERGCLEKNVYCTRVRMRVQIPRPYVRSCCDGTPL